MTKMKKFELREGEYISAIVPHKRDRMCVPFYEIHIARSNGIGTRTEALYYPHELEPQLIALFDSFCTIYEEVSNFVNSANHVNKLSR